MIRKVLLPALLVGMLAGCASNYYYRDAGNGGGYYYGEPTVEYDYYGGYGWYGYGWGGWPYFSACYGPHYGCPYYGYGYGYPYYGYWDPYWPYYDGDYWNPEPPRPDDPLVEKQGNDIRHLRIVEGASDPRSPVMPPREGALVERHGGQPHLLRMPGGNAPRPDNGLTEQRGGEPHLMRMPAPRPEPRTAPVPQRPSEPRVLRTPEPRTAPSMPPMRAPSPPPSRSVVRRNEE